MTNEELSLRLQRAESLLVEITMTGSYYQIKEKIDNYFNSTAKNKCCMKNRKCKDEDTSIN